MNYEQKRITCRQCSIYNTYICQTKSKHHFFIFIYTGSVQTFTAPHTTTYKLEVWGAEGERYWENTCVAGKGGYSSGEKTLSFSTKLYVAIGGKANNNTGVAYYANSGGYNGGGNGQLGGGGATHIAITNDRGVLANYVNNKDEVLIVAGGGGGADHYTTGGDGGGNVGLDASNRSTSRNYSNGKGGTQSAGGGGYQSGSFGKGGDARNQSNSEGAGGGGWYGGGSAYTSQDGGGGGGSGYIGGISNGSMLTGIQEGNGKALITWMPVL